jgi:glycosyltransferase involved in cell wall biosynthesis
MKDLISVIIPTFNSSGTLKLALKTVLQQESSDFEVWVVGDGCTDDSESVVSTFGDKRLNWINLPENTGSPNVPRNEGLKRARGRYIAYLGHDDLWFPWHLSKLIECVKQNNSDLVYSLGVFIIPEGVDEILGLPERSLNPHWSFSPSNWLHKKELLERVGGWPQNNKYAADMMVVRRFWKIKARIGFQKELSVLKFCSSVWSNYSLKSEFPQSKYVDALIRDPQALRLDLLHNMIAAVSNRKLRFQKKKNLFRVLLRKVMVFACNVYGTHRWPVNQLLRLIWRRKSGLNGKRK